MAKKVITKKLKKTDDYEYTPENLGAEYNYKIYAYSTGNKINDADGNDYLYGGAGNDVLVATKGDDTLSGGLGTNTLKISGDNSGDDVIVLGKGTDNLVFETSNGFSYSKSGNNLIINHKKDANNNGHVTVNNYFKTAEDKISLKTLNENDLNTLINANGLIHNDTTDKNKKITGTYLNDIINAQGDTKNTITTGRGNDTITAGQGNDTITIDGSGTKTIQIKKDDGDDVITYKNDGLNAKTILSFDSDMPVDSAEYKYLRSGNDLLIQRTFDVGDPENTSTKTTTIKDYFKNNPDVTIKRYNDAGTLLVNAIDSVSVEGNPKRGNKLTGTKFNDSITGGVGADKITTGNGNDTIDTAAGNDTILIDGSGNKTIIIGADDGNDTITFDLDNVVVGNEKIRVDIDLRYDVGNVPQTTYSVAKNQQDLLIINQYNSKTQTITVKNYFGNTNKVDLYLEENNVYEAMLANQGEPVTVGKTTYGTPFGDSIVGTESADIIQAYAGNDTITATRGNDKIYGGDGDDRYVYDGFFDYDEDEPASLGHDIIYNGGGSDTISIGIYDSYAMANSFEPSPIFENSRVYPEYQENGFGDTTYWVKSGNDLILSSGYEWKDSSTNTITLKDYFKYGKDGFGVKYLDNGLDVNDAGYEKINILDNAALRFDSNIGTGGLSGVSGNNFTGTFMNDIIMGSSKADVLRGGDGNDIIYGREAIGSKKDNLYGDAGNDTLFASDANAYGGTGNDIYVSDVLYGGDSLFDESGHDRISLMQGKYLTYFDVTQENGEVTSIGNIYIKDISASGTPIREIRKSNWVVVLDENGHPVVDEYDGRVVYEQTNEEADEVVARFAGRPCFEVSDDYYEQLKDDPSMLENFNDYGDNKRYLDGHMIAQYQPREGYKLIYAGWDLYVKDYQYDYHGTDVQALEGYDDYTENAYPENYAMYDEDSFVTADGYRCIYDMKKERRDVSGIRSIVQNKDSGIVIKNGTTEGNIIETITIDRGYRDSENMGISYKEDNWAIGDYSQEKINTIAQNVAEYLNANNFTSVQDAIKRGTDPQLTAMFALFDGTYEWTENVKFRRGSYATDEILTGTNIIEDGDILGPVYNSTYTMGITKDDRASMISDYSGEDEIILNYNEGGYSLLFDVEVDKDGKLLNYSRDFYVKFAGEEANNTGVIICNGRETRHAIETISMKTSDGNDIEATFAYDQNTIDEVRQNVAGWLTNNGFESVLDVLDTKDNTVISDMMAQFAPINTLTNA